MPKINAFHVFCRMIDTNDQALKLAPLGNILGAKKVKAGTKVTIGVEGDIIAGILNGEYVGGLILCDKQRFDQTKRQLESEERAMARETAAHEAEAEPANHESPITNHESRP